ncbi:MAG: hypothetical protein O3C43_05710 [Verrucomicrobia bacterium]|nr:hypothetical protein [Verrucomicrobiota bacterium]MDA1065980.1 hypothetical protein [Verrucomicrobiota bacterium]
MNKDNRDKPVRQVPASARPQRRGKQDDSPSSDDVAPQSDGLAPRHISGWTGLWTELTCPSQLIERRGKRRKVMRVAIWGNWRAWNLGVSEQTEPLVLYKSYLRLTFEPHED